ncbi:helix-turn-helix domain-containing protein [Arenicella sp. 4NH20-0111]|uniref:helix-turn-helix domain-containing protein n=1 Tax=Arenicella sp. 4NH20-0111 TaxID=3127648 RepID=UPI003340AB37
MRVKKAIARLEDSNDPVLNIFFDAGFNSRSSFYSTFAKVTGTRSAAYRKKHRVYTGKTI